MEETEEEEEEEEAEEEEEEGRDGEMEEREGVFIKIGPEMQAIVTQQRVLWAISSIFVFIMRTVGSLKDFKQGSDG